jgi:hypothetical protein
MGRLYISVKDLPISNYFYACSLKKVDNLVVKFIAPSTNNNAKGQHVQAYNTNQESGMSFDSEKVINIKGNGYNKILIKSNANTDKSSSTENNRLSQCLVDRDFDTKALNVICPQTIKGINVFDCGKDVILVESNQLIYGINYFTPDETRLIESDIISLAGVCAFNATHVVD